MQVKVGVLTSGGDAPGGMNAELWAVIVSGIRNDLEMFAIFEGFRGIIEEIILFR